MNEILQPTLWRTCRVLANRTRLRILSQVLKTDSISVTDVMKSCDLVEPKASQHLRLLQSRGLLSVHRMGRHVFYRPEPDPLVGHAAAFLSAIRASFRRAEKATNQIMALTAFTHPRRILVVRALVDKSKDNTTLSRQCGISSPALYRHLRKLRRRGIVDGPTAGNYVLNSDIKGLARELVRIATSSAN